MSNPTVDRYVNGQMERERAALARDAQDISDAFARFAKDVHGAIARGEHSRVAQEVQQLLIRATRLDAMRETAELYADGK